MYPDPNHDSLPPELEQALRSLGAESAPPELADRVRLARLGTERAPAELRHRVELALFGGAAAPAELEERVRAEVQRLNTPVFRFRVTWPRAVAAALLVTFAVLMGPWSQPSGAPDSDRFARYAALRAEVAEQVGQRFVIAGVPGDELDPATRGLAVGFGAPLVSGGAE